MTAVAKTLNEEWKEQGVQVFALTDYYEQGRVDYRAWLLKEFGYDDNTIGTHAGISDTSQLLHREADSCSHGSDQTVGRPSRFWRVR